MSCKGTIDSLKDCFDSVLAVRESAGLELKDTFRVVRTWSGKVPGDGAPTDTVCEIKPKPGVRDFSHDIRLREGGQIKEGDIIVHQISKNRFPLECNVDGTHPDKNVEVFYKVGGIDYRVINVVEKHLWWNVQLRRLTPQEP